MEELWEQLARGMQAGKPVHPKKVKARISPGSGNLFTPWGPPYNERGLNLAGGPESQTIKVLTAVANLVHPAAWVFLGADDYAISVNRRDGRPRVSQKVVSGYFRQLQLLLKRLIPSASFHLWSEVKEKEAEKCHQLSRDLTDEFLLELVGPGLFDQACEAARRLNDLEHRSQARDLAFRYLRERLIESEIAEALWQPVKISLAPPHKDLIVDGPLPVLYLVPKELRTPWLK